MVSQSQQTSCSGSIVVSFMRANPPTIGHKKVIEKICSTAKSLNCDSILFLSASHDRKKNPIPFRTRRDIIKSAIPEIEIHYTPVKDLYSMLNILSLRGYRTVYIVAGSDRIKEYEKFKKYTNILNFDNIILVSAGERDKYSKQPVECVSATYLRELASQENAEEFKRLCIHCDDKVKAMMLYTLTVLEMNKEG